MANVAQMIRYFIDYICEWRITMEKASDNDFFPILQSEKLLLAAIIYSLRQSNVNLSGDPRRELIRLLWSLQWAGCTHFITTNKIHQKL